MLAACHPPKSGDTLAESVQAYNEGVRWERYNMAAAHVPPAERAEFIDDSDERSKDLRITDYEVIRMEQRSNNAAQVQIKMSWYLDSQQKLRETSAVQNWERHGKTWWVVDETRLRGDEMPGLREAPTTQASEK
jgi:hypothetical protein